MDSSAIKEITADNAAKDGNTLLKSLDALLTHKDYNLHNLDHLLPAPRRAKGHYQTPDLESFAEYSLSEGDASTAFFIDPEAMQARAILDFGNQVNTLHKDNTASFAPEKTPDYQAVISINGASVTQRAMAEFLEDWSHNLTFTRNGESVTAAKAISAVRKITIEAMRKQEQETQSLSESRSAMERIEAKSDEGLPDTILFTCKPYEALQEYTFSMRLSISTGNAITLKLTVAKLDQLLIQMASEFKALVTSALKSSTETPRIFIGKFNK